MQYIQTLIVLYYLHIVNASLMILSNDFASQTFTSNSGWNVIQAQNPISSCSDRLGNSLSVFGAQSFGQNTLVYKTYDLQSHFSITIDFQLWIFDYVQSYDYNIYIDDQLVGTISGSSIIYEQDLCGKTELDGFGQFSFTIHHISSFASVIFTSDQDQDATITSWGIRDFQLSIEVCPIGCIYCQDDVSECTIWLVDNQFWTTFQISSSEGWQNLDSNYAYVNCLGLDFLKIYQVNDILSNTIDIKPYYQLNLQFKILKAGNFQNEQITLTINSVSYYQQTFGSELYFTQCSGQSNEGDVLIPIILHFQYSDFNSNQLNFAFLSDAQSTQRFWGIRDFYIFISPCLENCLLCTNSIDCQQCDSGYTFDGIDCLLDIPESSSYVWTNIYTQFMDQLFVDQLEFNFTDNQIGYTITQCNGYSLLGGYQVGGSISATIPNLPFHNRLRVRATVYAIDQWYKDNPLQMSIDGTIFDIATRDKYASNQQNLCGSSLWGDNRYQIDIDLDHLSNNVTLSFNFLNQLTNCKYKLQIFSEYFGFRDVIVDHSYCGQQYKCGTCDSSGNCLTCSDPQRDLANGCNCPTYEADNQQCPFCDRYNAIAICYRTPSSYACDTVSYTTQCKVCIATHHYNGSMCLNNNQNFPVYDVILHQNQFIQYPYVANFWNFYGYRYDNLITGDITSQCGPINLLGGIGHKGFFRLILNKLPPYRRVRVIVKVLIIDQGDGESLNLIFQGVLFQQVYRDWRLQGQNLCGDQRPEFTYLWDKTIPTTGQLVFKIQNSGGVENYFGIYDLSLYYQLCHDIIRCATCDDNGCLTCSVPARIQSPQCLCPTYEYQNYSECPTCPYKCLGNLCDLQGCTVCANAQRSEPPWCLCPTYEIYGDSSCPPCQLNCFECAQNMCLQCKYGYYALGEYCFCNNLLILVCPYQCETCLYNGCLTCSDPSRGAAPLCRCSTYEIYGQPECPVCEQENCQSCNENGCLMCVEPRILPFCDCPSNYYEKDNNCIPCEINCETCNQYSCLTCPRNDLILPYCICLLGYQNLNNQCVQGQSIVESIGYFNQYLTQIIIELDKDFIIIGLQNEKILNEQNCAIIQKAQGLCQIQNKKIIYQFDPQISLNIGDEIKFNNQFFGFYGSGFYSMSSVFIGLNESIDYRPYFDLTYPNLILTCKSYIIYIANVIYIGNQNYILEMFNDGNSLTQRINNQVSITPLVSGQIKIEIKITNFVGVSLTKSITMESNSDLQIDFEILPQLGQLNRFFNIVIQINQIIVQSCIQSLQNQPITKMIDINFNDQYIAKQFTKGQQTEFKINVGSLNVGQVYTLNVTATYQNYSKTQITNYTINQVKPYFSILGGNRMVYYNNRLNVSAIIVDPDTTGLICQWSCIILDSYQDCGFNFTSQIFQIIENYELKLYRSYQFSYNCLGIIVKAIYNVVDINQDQLFIFYPAFYSTYDLNQQYLVQYIIFNETKQNLLKPIILSNINIRIIHNFTLQELDQQVNSYGQQRFPDQEGQYIIRAQIDHMISSFKFNLKNITMDIKLIVQPQQGIQMRDQFKIYYENFTQINQPYLYRYFAQINQNYTIQLSDWSIYQTQQFLLPLGDITQNYTVIIIGQIIDKFDYIYNKTSQIQVLPELDDQIDNFIEQFQDQDNYYQNMILLGTYFLQLQSNGCTKNCSNNGKCIDNQCVCFESYLSDCSANQTQFNQINELMQNLLFNLINTTTIDSQLGDLITKIISNKYIQESLQQKFIIQLVDLVISSLQEQIYQNQQIQINDIDLFVDSLQNPQNQINDMKSINNFQSLLNLLDLSFVIIIFIQQSLIYNSVENATLQNDYLMKILDTTKQYAYYQGTQLYQDQSPYYLQLSNFIITSYRVSNNYSQIFFSNPVHLQSTISSLQDQTLLQLRNDSIIGVVIFNKNPYTKDQSYPYPEQDNQVASISIYDNNGSQYRSFQPLIVQLKISNISNNSNVVCIGQKNGKWISQICQTFKITNSNKTSCQCDTLDQSSVVDDVNNLYSNSRLTELSNYYQLINYKIYENALAYILVSFGMCSIIFGMIGYKKDLMDFALQLTVIKEQQIELNYDSEQEDILINYDLMRMKSRNLSKEILLGIKRLHRLIRINNEFVIDQPRAARYMIFFLKQCILLSITSIFGQGFSIIQNISLGIISMILITPLEKLLMHGFHQQTKLKIKIILSIFIFIVYMICWYTCITVSLSVGIIETNRWTTIFLISFLLDQIVIEGFTIILKITFAPYLAAIIFKGGYYISYYFSLFRRIIYLYLYDEQAIKIVKDLNKMNAIQF